MMKERERSLATASTMEREAIGEIIARSAVEPHPFAGLASNNPEPVVLDLVQPQLPGWRGRGIGGKAWRNETRRQCTRIQRHRGHG
jgi:hypothetical protein